MRSALDGGRLLGIGDPPQVDSQTRAKAPKFGWDKRFDLWKLNPLADWSEKRSLELHPRERHALQPPSRPGLSLDRLHPLHPQAGRRRGRSRRALGRHRPDGVRAARLASASRPFDPIELATLPRFVPTSLQLNERQTADFEMLGNGGFAPLTGPQGSADHKSVVERMTPDQRRVLADPDHPGDRPRGLRGRHRRGQRRRRQGARPARGHRDLRARPRRGGRERVPDDRQGASGRGRDLSRRARAASPAPTRLTSSPTTRTPS